MTFQHTLTKDYHIKHLQITYLKLRQNLPPNNHLNYQGHLRFSVNIGITLSKLVDVINAIGKAYPLKFQDPFPNPNEFALPLKDYMDDLVHRENLSIKSLNPRCIYFSGLGQKIYKKDPIEIIDKDRLARNGDLPRIGEAKPGFTSGEYARIRTVLFEIQELYNYYEQLLQVIYKQDKKPSKLCADVKNTLLKSTNRFENQLKKRHGEKSHIFSHNPLKLISANSLPIIDIAQHWDTIRVFLIEEFGAEYQNHIESIYLESL